MVKEQIRAKIDISYTRNTNGECIPETWSVLMFYPNGNLQQSMWAKLLSYQTNEAVASNEFEIEFPSGTRVTDARDPKNTLEYIVKVGGRKRMILPEEIGATYDQIINTGAGEALGKINHSV